MSQKLVFCFHAPGCRAWLTCSTDQAELELAVAKHWTCPNDSVRAEIVAQPRGRDDLARVSPRILWSDVLPLARLAEGWRWSRAWLPRGLGIEDLRNCYVRLIPCSPPIHQLPSTNSP